MYFVSSRWRLIIFSFLMLVFLAFSTRLVHAKTEQPVLLVDVVAWLEENQAPRTLHQADLLRFLLRDFPLSYVREHITRNRARVFVSANAQACMPWLLKTPERETQFLFSLPYAIEPALVLVMKKDSRWAQQLTMLQNNGTAISLKWLLTQVSSPVLGIESNRSYGLAVDALLKEQHAFSIYTRTSSSNEPAAMLPMLMKGFVDAIIEYPSVLSQYTAEIVHFNFSETEPVQLIHFACSKTPEMRQLMPLIDNHIQHIAKDPQYLELLLKQVPENQKHNALAFWLAALENN